MREILSKIAEVDYYVRWYSTQHDLGIWPSRWAGGSAEFEAISEYELGDNPRSINWAATARTGGHQILKNTRLAEANLSVYLLVDLSPSMDFGTVRVTKRRLAAEISAVIAHAAWRCGDRVGFVGYGSRVDIQWPLRNPKDYRILIPQKVLEIKSEWKGKARGLHQAVCVIPPKRSLVFLLSDFQDDIEEIVTPLRWAAHLHDVVAIVLWDPRERSLPEKRCLTVLKDLETGRKRTLWIGGGRSRSAFRRETEAKERSLRGLFRSLCMDALWVHQESNYVLEISRLFLARRKAN